MTIRRQRNSLTGARKFAARAGFFRDREGVAAIEFALVSPIFLAMMFSMFEVGWFYYVNSVVDATVSDASRLIETGQLQKATGTLEEKEDYLFDVMCKVLDVFGDCDARLLVEVQQYGSFTALAGDTSAPVCPGAPQSEIDAMPFNPGGEQDIVRVRICFQYKTINPAIGLNLTEVDGNARNIISSTVFRNEPYEVN